MCENFKKLLTELNGKMTITEYVYEHGKEPKLICPISFFKEEERDKYIIK